MSDKQTRVVIAGAGLAGLTAARHLERCGATVTIFEARDRLGGRVLTRREGFAARQHGELGADLIEAEQTHVLELARALKLDTVRILRRGWGFYGGSQRPPFMERITHTLQRAAQQLQPEIDAYKAAGSRWDSAVADRIGRQSAAAWLERIDADSELAAAVRGLRGFFLADAEDLSLLALVDQFAEGDLPGSSAMYRLRAGNDALPAALARTLSATIHLSAPVKRIAQRGRTVTVTVGEPHQQELTADYIVCTPPATTLRRVVFVPSLPDAQAEAIASLRYGSATKILLQFEKRFWRGLARASAYASDRSTGAVWDANEEQDRSPGILTLLAGGGASKEIRAIIAAQGWKGVARKLAWLGRPGGLVAAASHSWETDPWSRGGYAVFTPRFHPALRGWLARPAGRVIFAGEHTSQEWQGFMNGAIESGRRAAIEVAMLAGLPYGAISEAP